MNEPQMQEYEPLSEEQLDEMLEAFNELQSTDHQAAILGQSGNMALEIRNRVIDPDMLTFILDVAERKHLRPYVFQTEQGAPIVLIPNRKLKTPAGPAETPTASAVLADQAAEEPDADQPAGPPPSPDETEAFHVDVFGDSVAISLPGADPDADGPTVSLAYQGIREQPVALEIAERIGSLAAAAVESGADPQTALVQAYERGADAFRRATARAEAEPVGMEDAVADAVSLEELDKLADDET